MCTVFIFQIQDWLSEHTHFAAWSTDVPMVNNVYYSSTQTIILCKISQSRTDSWKQMKLGTKQTSSTDGAVDAAHPAHRGRVRNYKELSAPSDEPKGTALFLFTVFVLHFNFNTPCLCPPPASTASIEAAFPYATR